MIALKLLKHSKTSLYLKPYGIFLQFKVEVRDEL